MSWKGVKGRDWAEAVKRSAGVTMLDGGARQQRGQEEEHS